MKYDFKKLLSDILITLGKQLKKISHSLNIINSLFVKQLKNKKRFLIAKTQLNNSESVIQTSLTWLWWYYFRLNQIWKCSLLTHLHTSKINTLFKSCQKRLVNNNFVTFKKFESKTLKHLEANLGALNVLFYNL